MTTKASIHDALINWGAVMRADMEHHGIKSLPASPPTSKQYRADNQDRDTNLEPPPDEQWAIEIQQAIVRLCVRDIDAAMTLTKRYRDNRPVDGLKEAQNKLWGML